MKLYEILVPTMYGDTLKPIRTKHHRVWDVKVQKLTGGLTIFPPGKGIWVDKAIVYAERVIPVRIMCEHETMMDIVYMTIEHYRQKCVMYYVLSDGCNIVYPKPRPPTSKEILAHRCRHGYTQPGACPSCINAGMTVESEPEDDYERDSVLPGGVEFEPEDDMG